MKRLGRGLADIITTAEPGAQQEGASSFVMLRAEQIRQGRFQPRTTMNPEAMNELKASIKRTGVIEPIVVRPVAHGTYELVAGQRRLTASQDIGIQEVPAIIKNLTDRQALEFSLVENIQRENLNPIEEAKGYTRLLDEFGYTQEDIASAVGKDRATVANLLRVLSLPEAIQRELRESAIALGHAKVLLSVEDIAKQLELCRRVKQHGLSVRQLETLAGTWAPRKRRRARPMDAQAKAIEDGLRQALGTKVNLFPRAKGGRIVIEFFSQEDLARIVQLLRVSV